MWVHCRELLYKSVCCVSRPFSSPGEKKWLIPTLQRWLTVGGGNTAVVKMSKLVNCRLSDPWKWIENSYPLYQSGWVAFEVILMK